MTIISKNGKNDYKYTYVHEIGHNLNLSHTFDERDSEGNLIECNFSGLRKKQTKENIMDYHIEANFTIKKQWEIVNKNKVGWVLDKQEILSDVSEILQKLILNFTPNQFTENKEDQILNDFNDALQYCLAQLLKSNTFIYAVNNSKFLLEPETTRIG